MIVRLLTTKDLDTLKGIHDKFYKEEFVFPFDGPHKLLDKYVVVDDDDKIITFGSLELSLEGIVITNKDIDIRKRREAFSKLLHCLEFSTNSNGFNAFHLAAMDEKWANHLVKRFGFFPCRGKFLYIET